ncbi:hypothetical protein PRIPAC_91948, partial [Pristionchus pacificus]|uniref:G protein-coupled receptor n=1 Tax=Pristionchus pacificus TaxID=54126 RepID=A0A2A6BQG5_PRIPA
MSAYFISPSLQEFLDNLFHLIFAISTALNTIVFFCFWKLQNSHQTTMRNHLIYLQIIMYACDVHIDVLFNGYPLFPLLAGYCRGILCYSSSQGIVVFMLGNVGAAIIICFIYRHQTVMIAGHKLKFNKLLVWAVFCCLIVFLSVPGSSIIFMPFDAERSVYLIETSPFNVTWIMKRGNGYMMYDRFPLFDITFYVSLVSNRSRATILIVRRSFVNLTVQLLAPYLSIACPCIVLCFGLLSDEFFSFEICLTAYALIHFHSSLHSFLIITLTPDFLDSFFHFIFVPSILFSSFVFFCFWKQQNPNQ